MKKMSRDEMLAWLDKGLSQTGLNDFALSKKAGVKDAIKDFRRGRSQILRADKYASIQQVFDEILADRANEGMKEHIMPKSDFVGFPKKHSDQVRVPYYSPFAAGGNGALVVEEEKIGDLTFQLAWLRSKTQSAPDKLGLLKVIGKSMEPRIMDGDVVMFDRGQAERVVDGEIYVVRVDDSLMVKIVHQDKTNKKYLLLSANPDFPQKDGPFSDTQIIGRVIWRAGSGF